jgi:hypothetical protein
MATYNYAAIPTSGGFAVTEIDFTTINNAASNLQGSGTNAYCYITTNGVSASNSLCAVVTGTSVGNQVQPGKATGWLWFPTSVTNWAPTVVFMTTSGVCVASQSLRYNGGVKQSSN